MVFNIKRIKILLMLLLMFLALLFSLTMKGNNETNLLKTLLPKNINNYIELTEFADKSSSVIKVIFEGEDEIEVDNIKNDFIKKVNTEYFELQNFDFSELLAEYKDNSANFLSYKTRFLLKNEQYDEVYQNAVEALYNPVNIQISDFRYDPYFLLNEFLDFNRLIFDINQEINEKYYDTIQIKIKDSDALSPGLSNKKIAQLIKLQTNFSSKNSKIYLSGSPIHSFYTSKNAMLYINIIYFLSIMLISILVYSYFKSLKPLIPIGFSISFGTLIGYIATKLWFNDFQIITMVFSVTLIGIGIDYSFHYFFSEHKDKIFVQNMTISLITTLFPFILLYLTGIEVLKQISVYTIFGLFAIFAFVLVFYSVFNIKSPEKSIRIDLKYYKIGVILFCIFAVLGYFHINFNDSLNALYAPSGKLLKAEKLYNKIVNTSNAQIITVGGDNLQNILEKEEKITDLLNEKNINYYALSKIMPSYLRQSENYMLIKNLYNKNLGNFSGFLSKKQIEYLKNKEFMPAKTDISKYTYLKDFLLNPNTSVIYVFSSEKLPINIENTNVINLKQDIQKCLNSYRNVILKILPITFICIYLFLLLMYGIKKSFKLCIPVCFALLTAFGISSFIMKEHNLFSIIALFMVMGFTIDYSVFRAKSEKYTEDAVFVSCLTSSFSFLLLSFSMFTLLKSIALVLFLGITSAYLIGKLVFSSKDEDINFNNKNWFQIKEQSAGEKRLLLSWYLYKIFGKNILYIIAFFVSVSVFIFSKQIRYYSRKYFEITEKYTGIKPTAINVFRHIYSYACSLVDKILIYSNDYNTDKIVFESEEKKQQLYNDISSGQGVFFICNHVGNIEVLQALLMNDKTAINCSVNIFLSNFQSKIFNEFLKTIKVEMPVKIFPVEEIGIDTFIELKENLDNGDIVFIAGDRVAENNINKTQSAKVFDVNVKFPSGTFKMAELMETNIYFISAIKNKDKYYVYFEKHETINSEKMIENYAKFMEKVILINPNQFFHFYDFFD